MLRRGAVLAAALIGSLGSAAHAELSWLECDITQRSEIDAYQRTIHDADARGSFIVAFDNDRVLRWSDGRLSAYCQFYDDCGKGEDARYAVGPERIAVDISANAFTQLTYLRADWTSALSIDRRDGRFTASSMVTATWPSDRFKPVATTVAFEGQCAATPPPGTPVAPL